MEKRLSALEALPNELKHLVFAALPDVHSLVCAALTGFALYHALRTDERELSSCVLLRQIKPEIFNDAIATWESKLLGRKIWTAPRIEVFFKEYSNRVATFLQTCDLSKALSLAQFHLKVQYFAKDLAERALQVATERSLPQEQVLPVNQNEMIRIERTFYRFEIYCNLFGDSKSRHILPGPEQRKAFWNRFSPWENEQLACVWEYLGSIVAPVFEDIAMNVPERIEYIAILGVLDDAEREFLQAQTSRGLVYIHGIVTADVHTRRKTITLPSPGDTSEETLDEHFIADGLDNASEPCEFSIGEMDPHERHRVIKAPFHPDPDLGPEEVWKGVHTYDGPNDHEHSGFVLSDAKRPLRECGYVFWDLQRLDGCRLIRMEWLDANPLDVLDERCRKQIEMKQRLQDKVRALVDEGILTSCRRRL